MSKKKVKNVLTDPISTKIKIWVETIIEEFTDKKLRDEQALAISAVVFMSVAMNCNFTSQSFKEYCGILADSYIWPNEGKSNE